MFKRRDLRGKRFLVTGGSSGIGRAIAGEAASRGARVAIVSRSEAKVHAAVAELSAAGAEAIGISADVTVPDDRRRMIAEVRGRWGGLDVLVNNAGVGAHGHFIDLGPDILRRIFEVNFFATAECCREAIPTLSFGREPAIVNVGSMTGRRGVPAWADYSASKFAVSGFSEALRAELVRFDIHLMLVTPGLTKSNLTASLLARKGRLPLHEQRGIEPAVVARAALNGLERNRNEVRVEREARLLLFINWLMPRYVDWRMAKVVRGLYAAELEELQRRRESAAKP
jgi:short-subunit dehydrogenase